jgi:hypothetical protein
VDGWVKLATAISKVSALEAAQHAALPQCVCALCRMEVSCCLLCLVMPTTNCTAELLNCCTDCTAELLHCCTPILMY